MKQTIDGYLPLFGGFYESVESAYFEEQDQNHQENGGKELDWTDYQNKVGKLWVDTINNMIPNWLEFEFETIQSPKYYNFETDAINTKTKVDINELILFINKHYSEFNQYCIDNFTSYDGFSSFFANTADGFMQQMKDDRSFIKYYNHMIDFVVEYFNTMLADGDHVHETVYNKIYEIVLMEETK